MRNRVSLRILVGGSLALALVACGSISDPERVEAELVSKVSGALAGVEPSGAARVALVWRIGNSNQWVVSNDAPLVAGRFTIDVAPPPSEYFARSKETFDQALWAPDAPDVVDGPDAVREVTAKASDGGAGVKTQSIVALHPLDTVGGGLGGTSSLESALAGFVVYVDENGNGRLDLEGSHLSSPDEIVGGNEELIIHCFRGGSTLAYEKLRDKAGVLPRAGCNLGWKQGRWLPADSVELKATAKRLPFSVCSRFTTDDPSQVCTPNETRTCHCSDLSQGTQVCTSDGHDVSTCTCDANAKKDYPHHDDPLLRCKSDGSWSYMGDPMCPAARLCDYVHTPLSSASCTSGGYFFEAPGAPAPDGWPCSTTP